MVGDPTWQLLRGELPGRCVGEMTLRNRAASMRAWRIDSRACDQ
jgi:hypothetical protein